MGVITMAKQRRLEEEVDLISLLPDGVLGDIVSFLPTKDGIRTQLLSSRWRHIWRSSAPLNVHLHDIWQSTRLADVSRALSAHPGPGRRFSVHIDDEGYADAALDAWLRSPALDNLQELEIHFSSRLLYWGTQSLWLPASVFRFSPTLRVASFKACVIPDAIIIGNNNPNYWSVLKQLTLSSVRISEGSLHALLAGGGCPVLESLLLLDNNVCPRYRIASPSLRSIGVRSRWGYECGADGEDHPGLLQLVIEDAPCLERLLLFRGVEIDVSVISAPRLAILGELQGHCRMIQFGNDRSLQGSSTTVGILMTVVPGIRVLALSYVKPCVVINLIKCFPNLETLHVEITTIGEEYASYDECWKLTGTLDIRLRKIVVLKYYHDMKSYSDFAKFFVLNANVLESMTLELKFGKVGNNEWIRRQRELLQIENRSSRGAWFDFVSSVGSSSLLPEEQVHDLSIHDPFERTIHQYFC
ncbi:unnamed protein product [Urochloa decumbens]|uniref:F-box domain-containing protein n=1 Tax=Urochloa decumbens TaxID=240449 RepID=A0ABC9FLA6_9POAL